MSQKNSWVLSPKTYWAKLLQLLSLSVLIWGIGFSGPSTAKVQPLEQLFRSGQTTPPTVEQAASKPASLALDTDRLLAQIDSSDGDTPEWPSLTEGVERTVLDNGLTVLTREVHTAPVVEVQVWYRVGSVNETLGNNGISHQLEHLLFRGTRDRPIQFGRLFDAIGSRSNAFTTYDTTAYINTVSSQHLNTILTLEADRLANTVIDPDIVEGEKRVVISELQGYENSPSYRLGRAVRRTLFELPEEENTAAYALPVGGTRSDVEQFTTEQIIEYYRTHYSPNNAILVLVGDFNTTETLDSVRELFSSIPNATDTPPSAPVSPSPQLPSDPIVLEEPGSLPLLTRMYPLPPDGDADVPALDLLSSILSRGRSGRFYQDIVLPGIANSVNASTSNLRGAGWMTISANAGEGQSLEQIDAAIEDQLLNLQEQPPSLAELERVKRQLLAGVVMGYRNISSQARLLGGEEISSGNYRNSDRYLQRAAAVIPADIQRVAQQYLKPELAHKGYFIPTTLTATADLNLGDGTTSDNPAANGGAPLSPDEVQQYLPNGDRPAVTTTPLPLPETIVYPNGFKLLLLPDDSAPVVTLEGEVNAGSGFDSNDNAGLAAAVAQNLTNGTSRQSALEFAATLENLGAGLGFGARREGVEFGGAALSRDISILVHQLADALQRPIFPEFELNLYKQRVLAGLQAQLDNPRSVAVRQLQQSLYPPEHPYFAMTSMESIEGIKREDIIDFYQTHYRPDTTTVMVVGNFDVTRTKALFDQYFSNWESYTESDAPQLSFPPVEAATEASRQYKSIAGKTQSITYLGQLGIDRFDPDLEAAILLNDIIGGSSLSSRLGLEIRDRLGLTYSIGSQFQTGRGIGPFLVSMQTDPEDVDQAVEETLEVLRQVQVEGVSDTELQLAKSSIVNSFPVGLANPDSVAGAFLRREVLGLPLADLYRFPGRIEAVTLEDVNRVARDRLTPDRMTIVTAGP